MFICNEINILDFFRLRTFQQTMVVRLPASGDLEGVLWVGVGVGVGVGVPLEGVLGVAGTGLKGIVVAVAPGVGMPGVGRSVESQGCCLQHW